MSRVQGDPEAAHGEPQEHRPGAGEVVHALRSEGVEPGDLAVELLRPPAAGGVEHLRVAPR